MSNDNGQTQPTEPDQNRDRDRERDRQQQKRRGGDISGSIFEAYQQLVIENREQAVLIQRLMTTVETLEKKLQPKPGQPSGKRPWWRWGNHWLWGNAFVWIGFFLIISIVIWI